MNTCNLLCRLGIGRTLGVRLISRKILLVFVVPVLMWAQGPNSVLSTASDAPAEAPIAPATSSAQTGGPLLPGEPGSTVDKRVLGVLPNYRTANGTLPFEPLTAKQKFRIAIKDTFDYPSYVLASGFAGLYQLDDSNPSYGQGVKGYFKRYGAAVADQDLGNIMTEGLMPSLLREDPRYFQKLRGSFKSRLGYALTRTLVAKTDNGAWRFNFSEFLGNGAVAAVGNWYYPDSRGFSPTMQRMFMQIGTDTFSNVLKEFWPDMKRKWFHKHNDTAAE